jgi:hypothetical protein
LSGSAIRTLARNWVLGNNSSLVAKCLPIPGTRTASQRGVVRLVRESEASRRRRSRVLTTTIASRRLVTGSQRFLPTSSGLFIASASCSGNATKNTQILFRLRSAIENASCVCVRTVSLASAYINSDTRAGPHAG